MLQSLPRVLRDMDAVRMEATLLRQQMQVVKDDIKKVWSMVEPSLPVMCVVCACVWCVCN